MITRETMLILVKEHINYIQTARPDVFLAYLVRKIEEEEKNNYKITQTFDLDDVASVAEAAGREDIKDNESNLKTIFNEIKLRWNNTVISDLSDNTVWDIILEMEAKGKL